MLTELLKNILPASTKQQIKRKLGWPDTKPPAKKPSTRPCAKEWPNFSCECELQLNPTKQRWLRARVVRILDEANIRYVENFESNDSHIAVNANEIEGLKEKLTSNGLDFSAKSRPTNINSYDFPPLKNGIILTELVPKEYEQIRVLPTSFCRSRRQDRIEASILVSWLIAIEGVGVG